MRRRFVAAVLHLVLGGFLPGADANAAELQGRAGEVVVDFDAVLATADDADDDDRDARLAREVATAGVDVVVLDVRPGVPPAAVELLMRRALSACRAAGTLKVVIPAPAPLAPETLCALAEPKGFHFAGVRRRDRALEFYRDLYSRRT
jgi:hypothetical protein